MRTLSMRLLLPLLLAASVAGCGTRSDTSPAPEPTPQTYLRITNQSWLDQTVYVVRSGQRQRLGMVGATSTARFRIPDNIVVGSSALRFQVDPIGSSRVSQSFEILVSPGDEVRLTIPPHAG